MRLDEDILRLLRYIRFQFAYGFTPASTGYDGIIKKRLWEIQDISIQRIRQEFDKILIHPSNIEALRYLKEIDFFKIFLPEVNILSEISGWPKHHLEWNVWEHTLLVIQSLNQLSLKPDQKLLLYWTAILHDIGKYETYSNDINWEVHYYNHEKVWAALTKEVAKKWKFSTKLSKDIEWLIRHHLYPQKLVEMKKLKVNTLMIHPLFPVLISLSFADGHGKIPAYILPRKKIMQQHETFLEKYHTTKFFTWKAIVEKYPELSGVDIGKKINELNTQILAKL
jgi:putative nucleotidyltransferase with HDIG domain